MIWKFQKRLRKLLKNCELENAVPPPVIDCFWLAGETGRMLAYERIQEELLQKVQRKYIVVARCDPSFREGEREQNGQCLEWTPDQQNSIVSNWFGETTNIESMRVLNWEVRPDFLMPSISRWMALESRMRSKYDFGWRRWEFWLDEMRQNYSLVCLDN